MLGMTPTLLARLAPYASVLTDRAPDPAVAATPVRQAIQDAFGPVRPTAAAPLRTVAVTARADGDAGGRFTRRATLRLGASAKEPLVLILAWGAPAS